MTGERRDFSEKEETLEAMAVMLQSGDGNRRKEGKEQCARNR